MKYTTTTIVTILVSILAILCLLYYIYVQPQSMIPEMFNNTCNNQNNISIQNNNSYVSNNKYCAGCHAQLPPHKEKTCCTPDGTCRCASNNNNDTTCKCCDKDNIKPLSRLEREDLHLYGYLVSLLSSLGVNQQLDNV